jgi:benzoyl-CoA reductase/2-hydroxyglutaryl-CoA dehydratase subunit BcrC/BadD/HgdB
VDTPPYHDDEDAFETVGAYVENGLREQIIPAIERLTGKPYDFDRLSEAMALTKRCAEVRNQCLDLSRHIPAPWSLFDICVSTGALQNIGGTPRALDFYTKLRAELEDRVAKKIGVVEGETYRLLYEASFIMWRWFGIFARKLAQAGACLVTSRYPNFVWAYPEDIDPESPLHSYARAIMRQINLFSAEQVEKYVAEAIEKYSIDGLFILSAHTCRATGAFPDIVTSMEKRFGVPGIILDADQIDPHFFSEAQLDTRLGALLEMIDARRRNKAQG